MMDLVDHEGEVVNNNHCNVFIVLSIHYSVVLSQLPAFPPPLLKIRSHTLAHLSTIRNSFCSLLPEIISFYLTNTKPFVEGNSLFDFENSISLKY